MIQEKSAAALMAGPSVGQGNKRKPSFGDWSDDWTSQELSFDSEFTEENTQHLQQLQSEQEKTEYFK